ncbi:MAG: hypothetical protein IJQ37_02885 [Clostridia bacterium]|nr:hypothetical protein [Clostridia bacterium]
MNIDKDELDALLSLDAREFAEKINVVTSRLGMRNATIDPERVRTMLRSMSESDLSHLLSSLGEERAASVIDAIKGRK